jgi:hypothetical protein
MLATILTIHGHSRWILLALAIALLVLCVTGLLVKRQVSSLDKTVSTLFAVAMTLQFVLGLINIINFIAIGAFNPARHMEHLTYGLIATGLAHAIPMRKDARPDAARFRSGLIFTLVSLVLVLLSVIRLRGGWM